MPYAKTNGNDNGPPAIDAANLNKVEQGIEDAHNDVSAHVNDSAAAHAASAVGFTPAGSIGATDVQAAIEEVASESGGTNPLRDHTFNLLDWSATPDGATINTAIGDIAAAGGGTLLLPRGTIDIGATTIELHGASEMQVSLVGAGIGATTISYSGAGAAISYGDPAATAFPSNAANRVSDFTIQAGGTANLAGSVGIYIQQCLFPIVERVTVQALETGYILDGGASWVASGMLYQLRTSNVVNGLHVTADSGKQTNDMRVIGGYFYGGPPAMTAGYGVRVSASSDTNVFMGVSVEEFHTGYSIESPAYSGQRFFAPRSESCTVPWARSDFSVRNIIVGPSNDIDPGDNASWNDGDAGMNTIISQSRTFPTVAALPTPSVNYRGAIFRVEGGAGVADRYVVCVKNAADAYVWQDMV